MPMPNDPPKKPENEQRLLARFRHGEAQALGDLFDQYASRLLTFAYRLTGCRCEAEDLVQDTFIAALHGAERFRAASRLETYLTAILIRRHRDKGRRQSPKSLALEQEWLPATRPDEQPESVVPAILLEKALARLDAPMREAFLLVMVQGFTSREASVVLGEPAGTIRWRVSEATKQLRVFLHAAEEDKK